jgi:hypothetical protein
VSLSLKVLESLASTRLTLAAIVLLGLGSWIVSERPEESSFAAPLIVPLAILSANLVAAIVCNKGFRRSPGLLAFHLALLALVILGAVSRLTYLEGRAEVATGHGFSELTFRSQGPWHRDRIGEAAFTNHGFTISYLAGLRRDRTVNRVSWRDEWGIQRMADIGDQVPLVIHGYRFYTTSNKGFAAMFRWEPATGEAELGTVNFPSYPLHANKQNASWRLGGNDIQVTLNIGKTLIDSGKDDSFRMPESHTLTLDLGWRVATMSPGDTLVLPTGRIVYLGLTTWMGYSVIYDWTVPWLLAACGLAVLALAWHFWQKFAQRPWQAG